MCRLTEAEFREAAAVIGELGKLTTDTHNEIILMAGSLGVSSLVCLLNNGDQGNTETAQSLLGPFWRLNSPRVENGGCIVRSDTPGAPLFVTARVVDPAGHPIAGAEVDIWHASPVGLYENQDPEQAEMNLRGKFTSDADGRFWFRSVHDGGLSDSDQWRGRPAVEATKQASLSAGASPRADLQAGIQGVDFPGLRSRRPAHRQRRAVWRDARR